MAKGIGVQDKRRAARESTYKVARIGGGGRASIHCGVRNLSATGACLRLDDAQQIPDRFNLVFDSGEPSRLCRVVWRNARSLGVQFE